MIIHTTALQATRKGWPYSTRFLSALAAHWSSAFCWFVD